MFFERAYDAAMNKTVIGIIPSDADDTRVEFMIALHEGLVVLIPIAEDVYVMGCAT